MIDAIDLKKSNESYYPCFAPVSSGCGDGTPSRPLAVLVPFLKPTMQGKISPTSRTVPLILVPLVLAWLLVACRPDSNVTDTRVGIDRAIQNKGSDTMVNLALAWAESYRGVNKEVSIAVTGGGSGTGIASLINGTADIANASRPMKDNEIEEARANGIEPVEHVVAIDALAIIVHPDNPINEVTIDQLSDIFTGKITRWQGVGGNDSPIILVSRETNSGTHVYFLEQVVRKGDKKNKDIFAPQTLLMPSSVGITSEVRRNINAIGYDGLGYVDTQHEKVLAVAKDAGSPRVFPSAATAADGSYPLARNLYMYTVGKPKAALAEYLDWIMGPAGQKIVADLGFVPLAAAEQKHNKEKDD